MIKRQHSVVSCLISLLETNRLLVCYKQVTTLYRQDILRCCFLFIVILHIIYNHRETRHSFLSFSVLFLLSSRVLYWASLRLRDVFKKMLLPNVNTNNTHYGRSTRANYVWYLWCDPIFYFVYSSKWFFLYEETVVFSLWLVCIFVNMFINIHNNKRTSSK